ARCTAWCSARTAAAWRRGVWTVRYESGTARLAGSYSPSKVVAGLYRGGRSAPTAGAYPPPTRTGPPPPWGRAFFPRWPNSGRPTTPGHDAVRLGSVQGAQDALGWLRQGLKQLGWAALPDAEAPLSQSNRKHSIPW